MVLFMTKKTAKTPRLSDRTLRSEKRIRPTPPCSCSILTPASTEDVYRTIFETTGTSTIIVGEDMSISMANRECEDLLGYTREEIRNGKKWDDFIASDELERLREYHRLRRIDPDAVPKTYETRLIDRKGNIKDVSITADLIPGTKNSVVSILDITKHKEAEEALRESEDRYRIEVFASYVAYEIERNAMESQLRHLDKMKLLGQMAAGVAHEVRNPLNAILAITEALFQDIGDNPDYRPFLDHIRTQA